MRYKLIRIIGLITLLLAAQLYIGERIQINPLNGVPQVMGLGTHELADPIGYEKTSVAGNLIKSMTTSDPLLEFEKSYSTPIMGFSFELQEDKFTDLQVKLTLTDGSETDWYTVRAGDYEYGESEVTEKYFSQQFIFPQGISALKVKYPGSILFDLVEIPLNIELGNPELGGTTGTSEYIGDYASTQAEKEYLKDLFKGAGLNIVTRTEWGAPLTADWTPDIVPVDRIVVHHTATSVDMNDPAATIRAIYYDHAYNREWTDIGYNFIIDPYGTIYKGRAGDVGVIGAAQIPNTGAISISILGNYMEQEPTQASLDSLTKLAGFLADMNEVDLDTRLWGHRDVNATACPGTYLYNKLDAVANSAESWANNNSSLKATNKELDNIVNSREYVSIGNKTPLFIDATGVDADVKEKLLTESRGVISTTEARGRIFQLVNNSMLDRVIYETLLAAPQAELQLDYIYKKSAWTDNGTTSTPADYNATTHWNLEKINVPEAWDDLGGCSVDNTCGGDPSVKVAVLDTGVAYEGTIEEPYDYDAGSSYTAKNFGGLYIEVPGGAANGTYNEGYDRQYFKSPELDNVAFDTANAYDAGQDYLCLLRQIYGTGGDACNATELDKIDHANDDNGHGTFVTTIIAGDTDDGGGNQVVGIAHNTTILPIKVFLPNDNSMCLNSSGGLDTSCSNPDYDYRSVGTSFTLSSGIDHAVDSGADVINMSLSGFGEDTIVHNSIIDAHEAGVILVAAAGNAGSDIANYFPAKYEEVIAVGATNNNGTNTRSSYSNFGEELDIVAPVDFDLASRTLSCYTSGDDCASPEGSIDFSTFTSGTSPITGGGTSFAAPQVSALAALLLSNNSEITTPETVLGLISSVTDINTTAFDNTTGHGMSDAEKISLFDPGTIVRHYFPAYRWQNPTYKAWVISGNPSTTDTVFSTVSHQGLWIGNFQTIAENRFSGKFEGKTGGPVELLSTGPIYTTIKSEVNGAPDETAGFATTDLDTKFYYPAYRWELPIYKAWVIVGNPSKTTTANVSITHAGELVFTGTIAPGERISEKFEGKIGGPVEVTSDINVYTTIKSEVNGAPDETEGIAETSLSNIYYYPAYRWDLPKYKAWIIVGNPSTDTTANVSIYHADFVDPIYTGTIAPGDRISEKFEGVTGGPLRVESDINIYTTIKSEVNGAPDETAGFATADLNTKFYFPAYRWDLPIYRAWIIVGNPSTTQTANVEIKHSGVVVYTGSISPGDRISEKFEGQTGGPVEVTSTNGVNIYTTIKSEVNDAPDESPGIVVN